MLDKGYATRPSETFTPIEGHNILAHNDIDRAQNFGANLSGQYISLIQSDRELHAQNHPNRTPGPSEAAAVRRLFDAISRCRTHGWGPDIVIKAFLDLDKIFFCGRLRDVVKIVWVPNIPFAVKQDVILAI